MRWSKAFIPTLKEDPKEAEAISHKLMLRAGLIRKLSAGTYSYLPLGWRILNKIIQIVREEMNRAGAQEVLLPAIHPKELWQKSGRYQALKKDILITFVDRHGKEFVFGPTHEEIITDLVRGEIRSYRQLPQIIYQIQTKFRDEPRPRFGIIRTSEFIMKDAYSFDRDWEGLEKSYSLMYESYSRIFERCGLNFIPVEADPGMMGGDVSHEFMAPAESGEDRIALCSGCGYAASLEKAASPQAIGDKGEAVSQKKMKPLREVDTPGITTVEKVSKLLKVSPNELVKTIIFIADGKELAVLVRGDHEINQTKLQRYLKVKTLELARARTIEKITGGPLGYSGPVGLKGIKILADYSISGLLNFVTGANKKDKHLINVNLNRDFRVDEFGDFRYIKDRDTCPKCMGQINIKGAIEIGHVFKLGTKYSYALGANFLDEDGKDKPFLMGCYGIGINRILASFIEQNHDEDGIIWRGEISPFTVLILPVNLGEPKIKEMSEKIYQQLREKQIPSLFDDRALTAGIKFKDADLIGIPIRLTVGRKFLEQGLLEIKLRQSKETFFASEDVIVEKILDRMKGIC